MITLVRTTTVMPGKQVEARTFATEIGGVVSRITAIRFASDRASAATRMASAGLSSLTTSRSLKNRWGNG